MSVIEHMSPAEREFIKVYVAALRRDYGLIFTVFSLMDPAQLAVTDVAEATRIAVELQHMHAEFEVCLHNLQSCRKFFKRGPSFSPTLDQLANLFTLSFFKILTSVQKKNGVQQKVDAGWFSGKPEEWHKILEQLEKSKPFPEKPKTETPSAIFNLFSKFFPQFDNLKYFFDPGTPKDNVSINIWPPTSFGKKNNYDVDAEDPDYPDDNDNPFWPLFQDYYEDDDDED